MSQKLEIIGNYLVITNTVDLTTIEYPTNNVRYKDDSTNILFSYINDNSQSASFLFSELVDSNGIAFTDLNTLLYWLRTSTGKQTALDVSIQDNPSNDISLYMAQKLDDVTILVSVSLNDESINIETTGATPIAGNFLCLREDISFFQAEILTVTPIAGNQYTLDISIPFDFAYTTVAGCELQNVDMNVNGSVTPIEFNLVAKGLNVFAFDIIRMSISMVLSTAGDDGLFGNITKLTKGMYFRTVDGVTKNLFNARNNSDFASESAGDTTYTVRSGGGGSFGSRSRISFNGDDKRGVVKRLITATEDKFVGVVRDDLTALNEFRIKLQGHVAKY